MDAPRHLLSRIVAERNLTPVADAGITSKFFVNRVDRQVFEAIVDFQTQHGSVPTLAALKMDFPDYKFIRAEDPLSFLIEKVQEQHSLAVLEQALSMGVDAYDNRDPEAVIRILTESVSQIASDIPTTRDVEVTSTGIDRLERYRHMADNPDELLGAPTGFATLDRATQGLQKEHLVTIVGPPKAGKSTLLLLVALAAWVHGFRVLLFTFEMSNDEMSERLDAFKAGISHARLRTGRLHRDEWDRLERAIEQMKSMQEFWFSADTNSASTLSGIAGKIDKHKPDIVFVDGVYMLTDEATGEKNTPQALTNLTRGFKRLAQNKQIPVVISSQVLEWKMDKKKGITSNSIGYSSSFAQDSNTIIGVEKTEDESINKIKIVLARNCPSLEVFVQWNWENGTFEELNSDPFAAEGNNWDEVANARF